MRYLYRYRAGTLPTVAVVSHEIEHVDAPVFDAGAFRADASQLGQGYRIDDHVRGMLATPGTFGAGGRLVGGRSGKADGDRIAVGIGYAQDPDLVMLMIRRPQTAVGRYSVCILFDIAAHLSKN